MRFGFRQVDRVGAAMLVGALAGFVIGAVVGLSSADLAAPVLWPFAGAGGGILLGALLAGTLGRGAAAERGRRQARERALSRERLRREAHRGWIDGIDLTADAPPPPPPRTPRLRGRRGGRGS